VSWIVQLNHAPNVAEHARATVLAVLHTEAAPDDSVTVLALMEVRPRGAAAFRAHVRGVLPAHEAQQLRAGATTAVYLVPHGAA
jgi:hypothetical protein